MYFLKPPARFSPVIPKPSWALELWGSGLDTVLLGAPRPEVFISEDYKTLLQYIGIGSEGR